MINLILVCVALNIYPTVCVEWIAQPNTIYTMYFSKDLVEWQIVSTYDRYISDSIETNRMWRGRDEPRGFFRVETQGVFRCHTCLDILELDRHDPDLVRSDMDGYIPRYLPPFVFSDATTNAQGIVSRELIGGLVDEAYANDRIGHAFVAEKL